MEPIFAIWKPKGPTSFRVIAALRKLTGEEKIGHAGTLDPLAEGVMVIGFGRTGTKQLSEMVAKEKEYEATIKLGYQSSTDDGEGSITQTKNQNPPSKEVITEAIQKFIGSIAQIPPIHSAMKVGGKRSYTLARQGKKFSLPSRTVFVKDIKVIDYSWPLLKIKVTTGPGVYIRSLARDIGNELTTGGYLVGLVRTRVGQFDRKACKNLELTFPQNKEALSRQG